MATVENPKLSFSGRARNDRYENPDYDIQLSTDIALRDLFAAAALTGLSGHRDVDITADYQATAEQCGRMADAMLEERGKR